MSNKNKDTSAKSGKPKLTDPPAAQQSQHGMTTRSHKDAKASDSNDNAENDANSQNVKTGKKNMSESDDTSNEGDVHTGDDNEEMYKSLMSDMSAPMIAKWGTFPCNMNTPTEWHETAILILTQFVQPEWLIMYEGTDFCISSFVPSEHPIGELKIFLRKWMPIDPDTQKPIINFRRNIGQFLARGICNDLISAYTNAANKMNKPDKPPRGRAPTKRSELSYQRNDAWHAPPTKRRRKEKPNNVDVCLYILHSLFSFSFSFLLSC